MRNSLLIAAALAASVVAALAQSKDPPAQSGPNNSAVNKRDVNNSDHPVAGANSFTESQARSRIESNGYSNVSELAKDESGVWRGKATRDGKSVSVSLDFQGNVIAR